MEDLDKFNIKVLFRPLSLLFVVFAISCSEKPRKIGIEDFINEDKLNLCLTPDWDSAIVVMPYMREEIWNKYGYRIVNLRTIKSELEVMESVDWKYFLVFIKDESVTSYIEVPIEILYINASDGFHLHPFIYRKDCEFIIKDTKIIVSNNK